MGTRGGHRFKPVGALTLKGLPSPVPAAAVLRGPSEPEPPTVRSPRRRRRITAAMVGVALLVAAVIAASLIRDPSSSSPPAADGVPAAVGYTPTYEARSCPDDVQEAVPGATCGTLVVPEDRTQPETGIRCASWSPSPGSRGGHLRPCRRLRRGHVGELTGARPRGGDPAHLSRGRAVRPVLTCPEYAAVAPAGLARPLRDPLTISQGSAALAACHARLQAAGIDTDHYTYEDTGADVLDLLRALHLDDVHLVSGYVATIGALFVVRTAPSAIRSLTLQGPVVPGASSYTDPTAHLAEAFDQYIELCEEDASCAALGDLRVAYSEGHQSYETSPATVVGDDGGGGKHDVFLDGDRLAQVIANRLFDPDIHPLLASGIVLPRGPLLDSLSADRVIAHNFAAVVPDFPWGAHLGGVAATTCTPSNPGTS